MPQSSDRLRNIFFHPPDDDGIQKAETILTSHGFRINKGMIIFPNDYDNSISQVYSLETIQLIQDAVDYLCDEWDYGVI